MQTYLEGTEYTSPDLEAGLIAAIRANPATYWEILDLLPANSVDGFAVHWKAWHDLARAIEADNPLPLAGELDGAPRRRTPGGPPGSWGRCTNNGPWPTSSRRASSASAKGRLPPI